MKITTKHASNSPVTSVSHKRFAVLFFQPTRCVNSLIAGESWFKGTQGVMERRKDRKLVFILITPRTFFGHASRVFSVCNPKGTSQLQTGNMLECPVLQKVILTAALFPFKDKSQEKDTLERYAGNDLCLFKRLVLMS